MKSERFARLKELLLRAGEMTADDRAAFLKEACRDDPELRREAEAILQHETESPEILGTATPALRRVAQSLFEGDLTGHTLSHFRITERLGGGGMGVVYRAEDLKLGRTVALKLLPPGLSDDPEAKERFGLEAKAASALDHPNICTIHEIAETEDNRLFMVMTCYQGETLKDRLERGPLKVYEAVDIIRQVARGLQEAHDNEIVHRDIKPGNVFLTKDGQVKILDFGLAKLAGQAGITKTKTTMGTVAYMSPEQARGDRVDHRTDLWSLGVLFYEMLAGERPFKGDHEQAVIYSILNVEPSPLTDSPHLLPSSLDRVVARCLAKNIKERFSSARDFLRELDAVVDGKGIVIMGARERLSLLRHRLFSRRWAPVSFAVIGLACAITYWAWHENGDQFEPPSNYLIVEPLHSRLGDLRTESFGRGLSEVIRARITGHAGLDVHAATDNPNDPDVRIEGYRLRGSVNRSLDSIRVYYEIVTPEGDIAHRTSVAKSVVDGTIPEIFDLQDQLLLGVSEFIVSAFGLEPLKPDTIRPTTDVLAYDFYLQARGCLARYDIEKNIDQSIERFQAALARDPNYPEASAGLAEAYWQKYEKTRDPVWAQHAEEAAASALELGQDIAEVHFAAGTIHSGLGRYEDAVRELNRAIELRPRYHEAYRSMGKALAMLGRVEEAEDSFKRAIKIHPTDWINYNWLGGFYFRHERFEEAASCYRRVLELTPDNTKALSNLGGAYLRLRRVEEAFSCLRRSLSIDPTAQTYVNLGIAYYQNGRFEDAADLFEEAVKEHPNDYRIWGSKGSALKKIEGRESEAREAFAEAFRCAEEALRINPGDLYVMAAAAMYGAEIGRDDEAMDYLEKVLRNSPTQYELLRRAALTYGVLGHREAVLGCLEAMLEAGVPKETILDDVDLRMYAEMLEQDREMLKERSETDI